MVRNNCFNQLNRWKIAALCSWFVDSHGLDKGAHWGAHKSGKGYKAISKCFQVPVATSQSSIKKYETFCTVENLRGCSRKPKVTPMLVRRTVREVKKTPRITTKAILVNLGSPTVQRTLRTAGFHGRRSRRMPLLQIKYTKVLFADANAHLDKEEDFWSSVLWSDETNIEWCILHLA